MFVGQKKQKNDEIDYPSSNQNTYIKSSYSIRNLFSFNDGEGIHSVRKKMETFRVNLKIPEKVD